MTRPLMLRRLTPKDPPDEIDRRITARAWDAAGRWVHDGAMFGNYDVANRRLCFGRGRNAARAAHVSCLPRLKTVWHDIVYTVFDPVEMGIEVKL